MTQAEWLAIGIGVAAGILAGIPASLLMALTLGRPRANPQAGAGDAAVPYIYVWKNNEKRLTLYNRPCVIVARLARNSAIVEFKDGERECVSRNALRRLERGE